MTIEDLKDIFIGIRDKKVVAIPFQLHRDNQINNIIEALGGIESTCEYFIKLIEAQPATFYENDEEYRKALSQ